MSAPGGPQTGAPAAAAWHALSLAAAGPAGIDLARTVMCITRRKVTRATATGENARQGPDGEGPGRRAAHGGAVREAVRDAVREASMSSHEVEVFDARLLAPTDQFEAWRHAINQAFVPLDALPLDAPAHRSGGFVGGLLSQDLGPTVATEVAGHAVRVRRDAAQIAASDPGVYKLSLQLHGYSVLSQDGREAALTPGDLALYDTTRPYVLDSAESFRMFVLVIPRDRLGLTAVQTSRLTAERISGRHGLGALASTLLGGLGQQLRTDGVDPDPRAVDAVLDLVTATLAQRLDPAQVAPTSDVMFAATTAWIRERLSHPQLSVEAVATSQHVSVRYLQQLFRERGSTPSAWIRRERLDRCRAELADPAHASRPVAAIGARWGFPDPSSFARTFKAETGQTPGEFREGHAPWVGS